MTTTNTWPSSTPSSPALPCSLQWSGMMTCWPTCTRMTNPCSGNWCAPWAATGWCTAHSNVRRVSSSGRQLNGCVCRTLAPKSWVPRRSNPCLVTTTSPCKRKCSTRARATWANYGRQTNSTPVRCTTRVAMHLKTRPTSNSCARKWAGWFRRTTRRWRARRASRCSCPSAGVSSGCSSSPRTRRGPWASVSSGVTLRGCSCCGINCRIRTRGVARRCWISTGACRNRQLRIFSSPCKMTLNRMSSCSLVKWLIILST